MNSASLGARRASSSGRRGVALAATLLTATVAVLGSASEPGRARADEPKAGTLAAGRQAVTGRVLDADGKPVAGCEVAVLVNFYRRSEKPDGTWPLGWHPNGFPRRIVVSSTGRTDGEGRFRLEGPGYAPALPSLGAAVVASAPGHGLVIQRLDRALAQQEVVVRLQPERVVRGRLVDTEGKPVAGVEVQVHVPPYDTNNSLDKGDRNFFVFAEDRLRLHRTQYETFVNTMFTTYCYTRPEGPFWPKPVVSDDQGRFLIRGLGAGKATLETRSDRIAPNRFRVETVAPGGKEDATLKLEPAPLLEGRVTEEGSGKPVAGARLIVLTEAGVEMVEARTDKDGRYAVRPFPAKEGVTPEGRKIPGKNFQVITHPPEGSPCLIHAEEFGALTDKDRQEFNLSLPVGVLVSGRVVEAGSGKPVAGARVQYRQRNADNPLLRKGAAKLPHANTLFLTDNTCNGMLTVQTLQTGISGADGRFQLAVSPGPGHLFVLGPTLDYVHVETTLRELEGGKPGAFRYYPHAIVPLDLKPGAAAPEVKATLRRGVTLRGQVVDPDGKPVSNFRLLCRSYHHSWLLWQESTWVEGRDGTFELPGCEPGKPVTAWFWDETRKLGATAELSGDRITVRLQPCGKAEVSCVDLDGKPIASYGNQFHFLFHPGTHEPPNNYSADRPLEANWCTIGSFRADAEGKATIDNLIPGATYSIVTSGGNGTWADWKPHTLLDFSVKSGETGQIRVVDSRRGPAKEKPKEKAVTPVDLQAKANQKLKESFTGSSFADNDLAELPGRLSVDGLRFDVGEGLIRLANAKLKDKLPEKVEGIKVDAKCAGLHVLHATTGSAADDTVVAKYVVRYEDKSTETFEVVYGKEVRDWWHRDGDPEPTRGPVAWKGSNEAAKAAGRSIRLFRSTWKNPHPDKNVVSIDLVSTLSDAAPFVVAITAEKAEAAVPPKK